MKEISIEEKAKAYDEVLERAREEYEIYKGIKDVYHCEALERIFHKLAESEDEKIRKWLVEEIYKSVNSSINKGFDIDMGGKALAWLEKQKEQKNHVWHDASEIPPEGKEVCILWEDGLITTDTWYSSDVWSDRMCYWCLSSQILPINKHKRKE